MIGNGSLKYDHDNDNKGEFLLVLLIFTFYLFCTLYFTKINTTLVFFYCGFCSFLVLSAKLKVKIQSKLSKKVISVYFYIKTKFYKNIKAVKTILRIYKFILKTSFRDFYR